MIKSSIKSSAGTVLIAPLFLLAAIAGENPELSNGRYIDSKGDPTYYVAGDGTVDWATFNGFRRYSAACIHCHGPDGLGSTFGPSLVDAVKTLPYRDFFRITAEGTKTVSATKQSVMPPFGEDANIKCYIDDIYIYLRARSDGAIPRGRPSKKTPKTDAWSNAVKACLGN